MVCAQLPVHHWAEGADAHRVGLIGKLLALHVASHHHGTLHCMEEHRGGVKGRRGVDGLNPLQHVLFISCREDKVTAGATATAGLNLELVTERRRE